MTALIRSADEHRALLGLVSILNPSRNDCHRPKQAPPAAEGAFSEDSQFALDAEPLLCELVVSFSWRRALQIHDDDGSVNHTVCVCVCVCV